MKTTYQDPFIFLSDSFFTHNLEIQRLLRDDNAAAVIIYQRLLFLTIKGEPIIKWQKQFSSLLEELHQMIALYMDILHFVSIIKILNERKMIVVADDECSVYVNWPKEGAFRKE